jgi:hypothetical protein
VCWKLFHLKKIKFHCSHAARRKTDEITKTDKITKRINERKDTGKGYRKAKMIYKTNLPKKEHGLKGNHFLNGKLSQSRETLI